MRKSKHLIQVVFAAMLAALCCISTLIIRIPTPTGGFVNLGDVIIIFAAWLLAPAYGMLSAAIGSVLADIFAGFPQYAPATFVIKGLMAFSAMLIFRLTDRLAQKKNVYSLITMVFAGLCAEVVMVAGYFIFEAFILHYGMGALASVIPNLIQAVAGIVGGTILTLLVKRTNVKAELFS